MNTPLFVVALLMRKCEDNGAIRDRLMMYGLEARTTNEAVSAATLKAHKEIAGFGEEGYEVAARNVATIDHLS